MKRPFYPLLLAVYPVLALLGANFGELELADALRPLLVTLALGLLLFYLLKLLLRSTGRAALAFALIWVLFFAYGHVYHLLDGRTLLGLSLGHHRILLPVWLLLLALGLWWALTRRGEPGSLTQAMNAVAVVLLVFPVFQIVTGELRATSAWSQARHAGGQTLQLPDDPPDIYYIILDAYGREDVLADVIGIDNGEFLAQLEALGFYVARCSLSNYAQTELSLSSSLNFDYLPALIEDFNPQGDDRAPLWPLLKQSAARQMLEEAGYQTVAFQTGYTWIQWEDADAYLVPEGQLGGLSAFEAMLVESTAGMIVNDALPFLPGPLAAFFSHPRQTQRDMILSTLDKLGRLDEWVDGPKFVYAHIIAPHDPYVFDRDGNPVDIAEPMDDAAFYAGYRDELVYLNKRVLEVVETILRNSATPPVIIIQGDHGPSRSSDLDRHKILNAYYLPGVPAEQLYPIITPVNSFRLVFDSYFAAGLGLLDDRSYFSVYETPYQFKEIVDECR